MESIKTHSTGKRRVKKFKILFVTAYDNIGSQFNGYQLHKALKSLGHQSFMAVSSKTDSDPDIYPIGNCFTKNFDRLSSYFIEGIFSLKSIILISSLSLYFKDFFKKADIIHLQLVYSAPFFSLLNLPIICKKHHVIWTLHDPWMMNGHCIYSMGCDNWLTGCGNCPDISLPFPMMWDNTSYMWKIKHWIMHHSNVTLVVASEWMYNKVKISPILSHLPCHIIPLGLDLNRFKPLDKEECRKRFGIPGDAHVISFRYMGEENRFKGWQWLEKALLSVKLSKPTYLIVFHGKGDFPNLKDKYNIIQLGWVDDENVLIEAYNASDIFVMPSVAEAFGMMAVESMACGTPVIVFDGTALPETINAPKSGIVVPSKDSTALSHAIDNLLNNKKQHDELVEEGLKTVRLKYDQDLYVQNHIKLYNQIIEIE